MEDSVHVHEHVFRKEVYDWIYRTAILFLKEHTFGMILESWIIQRADIYPTLKKNKHFKIIPQY